MRARELWQAAALFVVGARVHACVRLRAESPLVEHVGHRLELVLLRGLHAVRASPLAGGERCRCLVEGSL